MLVQKRGRQHKAEECFAYFKDNVTESISSTEANELKAIVASLRSIEYDSTVVDFLGNCSAIANYTDPEAVPTQLMPDLVEAYVLRGPEKAHAPLLEYQLLEIVQAAQLAFKQRCEQVADGGMSNPPRPLASGRVEASSAESIAGSK